MKDGKKCLWVDSLIAQRIITRWLENARAADVPPSKSKRAGVPSSQGGLLISWPIVLRDPSWLPDTFPPKP